MLIWCIIIGIFLVFVTIIALKSNKNKDEILAINSCILALLGIGIAIADDYFSQYDYCPGKERKYIGYKKSGLQLDALLSDTSNEIPYYIFVQDISKSMKGKKNKNEETEAAPIKRMIDNVSQYFDSNNLQNVGGDFLNEIKEKLNGGTTYIAIRNDSVFRLKLMNSIVQLGRIGNKNIGFSIIYFGDTSKIRDYCTDSISQALHDINGIKNDNDNTDFINLFERLCGKIDAIGTKPRTQYDKKDVIVYFFTDYINDVGVKRGVFETKRLLRESMKKIESKNINLTLYVMDDVEDNDNKKSAKTLIDIRDCLKKYLDTTIYQELDIQEFSNEIDYSITIKEPIPFFYKNSLFENSLRTELLFSHNEDPVFYGFRLKNYCNSNKQDYGLIHRNGKSDSSHIDTIRLSIYDTILHISRKDTVTMEISGYIPSPYQCPDIVVRDLSKRVNYIIPVLFFKECPIGVVLILLFVSGLVLLFFITIVKRKSIDNKDSGKDVAGSNNGGKEKPTKTDPEDVAGPDNRGEEIILPTDPEILDVYLTLS